MKLNKLVLRVMLVISITLISNQVSQDSLFNLRFDTLSINESLKIQRDFFSINIKYDTTHIELYYNDQRFPIVPISLKEQINLKWIKSTEYKTEILNHNRILLRQRFLNIFIHSIQNSFSNSNFFLW